MSLELKSGCFSYRDRKSVLNNISLYAGQGDLLSLLGPNGCGKTTLLKCLCGILDFESGSLYIDGKKAESDRNRNFGYVPQISGSPVSYSIRQMVLLGRSRFWGTFSKPGKEDYRRVEDALSLVGITHLADRAFCAVSGGEKQMALICRALVSEARILVFDEPTSALDLVNQHNVIGLMKQLAVEFGYTIIFSSHDPSHALHISDYTLLLNSSGCSDFGRSDDMINEENLKQIYGVDTRIMNIIRDDNSVYKGVVPVPVRNAEKKVSRCGIKEVRCG